VNLDFGRNFQARRLWIMPLHSHPVSSKSGGFNFNQQISDRTVKGDAGEKVEEKLVQTSTPIIPLILTCTSCLRQCPLHPEGLASWLPTCFQQSGWKVRRKWKMENSMDSEEKILSKSMKSEYIKIEHAGFFKPIDPGAQKPYLARGLKNQTSQFRKANASRDCCRLYSNEARGQGNNLKLIAHNGQAELFRISKHHDIDEKRIAIVCCFPVLSLF